MTGTISDPASWRPVEEFPGQLYSERTWLVGVIMLGVAYGVEVTIFCVCFWRIIQQTTWKSWKLKIPMTLYIWALFICGTIFMAASANMARLSFIDNRNYPGGPASFEMDMFALPVDNMGNVAFVVANWLADGLMIWRWHVVYQNCGVPVYITMFIPCATLTTSFVLGVLFLTQVSAPSSSIWATTSINYTLPYFCTSLALNITATIAIVARLLYFRNRVVSALGNGYGSQYITIAALIIESAVIYSASSLLFLVPYIVNHPIQNVFLGLLSPAQVIAPLMIILRVASGRAWSSRTGTEIASSFNATGATVKLPASSAASDSRTTLGRSKPE